MKRILMIVFVCTAVLAIFYCCKQEYIPQIENSDTRLLVVEGFLNAGQGATTIRLSRTARLTDTNSIIPERGAQVRVEGNNGTSFVLTGNNNGIYSTPQLNLTANVNYRLYIKTTNGKEYASDYTAIKYTPPIDSITRERENDGLRLYVNTHDPQNATRYYQWAYEETWEYRSYFYSTIKYVVNASNIPYAVVYRFPDHSMDTTIYKCWKTLTSTSIILGSSERLSADVIYLPFHFIEEGSEKLSVLYSVNLTQYALSHEKYLFLQKMKKNTEQMGTLFDPQPSQLSGNIHCLTEPGELVIGFMEVSQAQTKRKFIYRSDIPDWNYNPYCYSIEIDNKADSIAKYGVYLMPTLPVLVDPATGAIVTFNASEHRCVDCTLGRTNVRPPFWP